MDKEKVTKMNFFKKMWYSITKFEKIPNMAVEGFSSALKYILILTAIFTIFLMIQSMLELKTLVSELAEYVQDNIPEFTYSQETLSLESADTIIIDDVQYSGIDKIIINTEIETNEEKDKIENENLINGTTIFFFNDEIILKNQSEDSKIIKQSYSYEEFISSYTNEEMNEFNKDQFVQYLLSNNMNGIYIQYGISTYIYLLIVNFIIILLNIFELSILGMITSTIARIKIKYSAIYNMAVYSLTLSIILNIVYIVINYFTNFAITYFQVAYITIAYIYLAAAIFILKDDVIKKMQEVEKIKKEQKKVKEEIQQQEKKEEKEDNKENKDDKENKEEKEGDEPQGSEA